MTEVTAVKKDIKYWLEYYKRKWKQKRCNHEFKSLWDEEFIGMTLSWAFKPTKQFRSTYECKKCGKREPREYIYHRGIYDDKED
jgi:hypothetical protein